MAKGSDIYDQLLSEITFGRKYNRKRVKDAITLSLVQIKVFQMASDALDTDNTVLQNRINVLSVQPVSPDAALAIKGLGEEIDENRKKMSTFKDRIMAMEIAIEEQGLLSKRKP